MLILDPSSCGTKTRLQCESPVLSFTSHSWLTGHEFCTETKLRVVGNGSRKTAYRLPNKGGPMKGVTANRTLAGS